AARLHPSGEVFGGRTAVSIAGHFGAEFGPGGAADRADTSGLVADRVEPRLVLLEDVLVPANPDRKLAGCCARRAAAHGRIQHVRTSLGEGSAELLHDAR